MKYHRWSISAADIGNTTGPPGIRRINLVVPNAYNLFILIWTAVDFHDLQNEKSVRNADLAVTTDSQDECQFANYNK